MQSPQIPDATKTAAAQTKSNIDTAVAQTNLNSINQVTPTGSLTYTQTGTNADGTPKYTATTALNPAQQALLDKQTQTNSNLGDVAVNQSKKLGDILTGVDLSKLPQAGNANDVTGGAIQKDLGSDFSGDRTAVEAALRDRLNPQLDRQEASLRTRLAGQGIKEGSEAWNNAYDAFTRQRNDADLAITAQGLGEQQGEQQLALNKGSFANQAQQQAYNQSNNNFTNKNTANQLGLSNLLTSQNTPLNQMLALTGQNGVQQPNFAQTPSSGVQGTDTAGIINGQYQNQLAQSTANNNAIGSTIGTIGGWLFSDEKTKTDIQPTGASTPDGIPLKTFRYKGSPMLNMGVTAQDAQKKRPDAVRSVGGTKMVNYDRIGSPMLRLGSPVPMPNRPAPVVM